MSDSNYGKIEFKDYERKEVGKKKQDKTVSCVYELLNEGQSCKWMEDGTIILNRPASSSLLNKIKFRSFSANIRNDITNTNIPDLTFDLCARFLYLGESTNIYRGLLSLADDAKLVISNGSGAYVYKGANGEYKNNVNGEMVIDSGRVDLSSGLDSAYNNIVDYSNLQIKQLLGLVSKEEDENYYDYNSFTKMNFSKYQYLNGVNGLCVGFDQTDQKPLWLDLTTYEATTRTTKDYYNLLGRNYVVSLEEEGDKVNNNYKINKVVGSSSSFNLANDIPSGQTIIDISVSSYNDNGLRLYVFTSDKTYETFEDRKLYDKDANYYVYYGGWSISLSGPYDITDYLKNLIGLNGMTGDIYFGPCYGGTMSKSYISNGFFIYLIGNMSANNGLLISIGTNHIPKTYYINFGDNFPKTLDAYPYYGTDYWWLFLCQHFYSWWGKYYDYSSKQALTIPFLPYKDPNNENVWNYRISTVNNIGELGDNEIIQHFSTTQTPLLYLTTGPTAETVYICRYCQENSNTLYYSNLCPYNVYIPDIVKYCSPNVYSSYGVETLEFGNNNELATKINDYVFNNYLYYKYSQYSPFYTLAASKLRLLIIDDYYSPLAVDKMVAVNWLNTTHTEDYDDRLIYSVNMIDSCFAYDKDKQTINSVQIPVYSSTYTKEGIIEFYIRIYSNPLSFLIDPNIIHMSYNLVDYYTTEIQHEYVNGLVQRLYNMDDITKYISPDYYGRMLLFVELSNSDQTLKLVCDNYPTLNNIVFYLNETSMIDFKEADANPAEPNIKCKIVDANDEIIKPQRAKGLYSNITICLDWQFDN